MAARIALVQNVIATRRDRHILRSRATKSSAPHNQEIYDNLDGVLDTLLAFVEGKAD